MQFKVHRESAFKKCAYIFAMALERCMLVEKKMKLRGKGAKKK